MLVDSIRYPLFLYNENDKDNNKFIFNQNTSSDNNDPT